MKLATPCVKCISELNEPNLNFNKIEINDSGLYEFTCSEGHYTHMVLQDEKFEVLFDLGALALIDGYTREAVSSFVSSLERFYEYFIQIILDNNNIDKENFNTTWKSVKNMSERQLGAFYFLYLNEFNDSPPIFPQKMVGFRNNVIHKGYIPDYTETYEFGEQVFNYIQGLLVLIKKNYSDSIRKLFFKRQANIKENQNMKEPLAVAAISRMIGLSLENKVFQERTFEGSLKSLSENIGPYTK
ncbi:hypothetical protein [Halobacillus sp. Cin3]|uniref:hypothetical protein n=1 Tax=Halobacillus sp. Cin3 TaxID=2928441 RepID=UPI00248D62C1|nr:hypothetical protein [Halobacillus sp. Cin3]